MTRRLIPVLMLLAVLPAAAPAFAQQGEATPHCPQDAVALPAELQAWSAAAPLAAATAPDNAAKAELTPGGAIKAALVHTPDVHYAARPGKPGGTVAFGGLFKIAIAEPGVYRVALGNASWVDLIKDGVAAESIAHGGGPACSGIRKIVDYQLQKGDYIVQLSAGGDAETGLMIVKKP